MTTHHSEDEALPGSMAVGAAGPQVRLPADADHETAPSAPAAGSLATSGRDDVARGDTVSGLGLEDVGRGEDTARPRGGIAPGPQSGAPTPGNRYPEEQPSA
jgi:hypothetical protein